MGAEHVVLGWWDVSELILTRPLHSQVLMKLACVKYKYNRNPVDVVSVLYNNMSPEEVLTQRTTCTHSQSNSWVQLQFSVRLL